MLVRNWMSKNPICIDVKDTMSHAIELLQTNRIRRLPVLKNSRLAGIITDRDLKRASPSDATTLDVFEQRYLIAHVTVEKIMTANPITVPDDFTIEETARVLLNHKISGVPVRDHHETLVGIITETDIFRALIAATGVGGHGIQFAFKVKDAPGVIQDISDTIRQFGGRLVSLLGITDTGDPAFRKVYLRIMDIDRQRLPDLTAALEKKATLLYMIDHRDNLRRIF